MLLRSESDFIWVTNAAYDLAGLVTAYLKLFRKHINGYADIRIPDEDFAVTFEPSKTEGMITVQLWWTRHYTTSTPVYYDVDDDNFSEAWGADNTCGSETHHHSSRESPGINIPIANLMRSKEQMEADFVQRAAKIKADKAEALRLSTIAELEAKLLKLKEQDAQHSKAAVVPA